MIVIVIVPYVRIRRHHQPRPVRAGAGVLVLLVLLIVLASLLVAVESALCPLSIAWRKDDSPCTCMQPFISSISSG